MIGKGLKLSILTAKKLRYTYSLDDIVSQNQIANYL